MHTYRSSLTQIALAKRLVDRRRRLHGSRGVGVAFTPSVRRSHVHKSSAITRSVQRVRMAVAVLQTGFNDARRDSIRSREISDVAVLFEEVKMTGPIIAHYKNIDAMFPYVGNFLLP